MKTQRAVAILLTLLVSSQALAASGDIAFWLPSTEKDATKAQVKRNGEYFSVKLHSVYAYYKSGFFENIKKLALVTETATTDDNKTVQSTMLNKTWQQLDKDGDFIGVNDHLVVLSPATVSNVKIKVSFRGIGEDRFKFVFDSLSDSTLKTALSLSPATSTTISAFAPTVQKLLASSYTTDDPRQVLDISQSFIVYANTSLSKKDSLKDGYIVIISAREGKSDDLSKIATLDPQDIRLSGTETGLEYKDNGVWKPFSKYSYVVLSVTKSDLRGENESSNWFAKYSEAERVADEKLQMGEAADKVKAEALNLWRDGNALLFSDPNYIDAERKAIKSSHLVSLKSFFETKSPVALKSFDAKELGVSANFAEVAKKYKEAVAKQAAQVIVRTQGEDGIPLPDIKFRLTGLDSGINKPIEGTTNDKGELVINGLSAGKYSIESGDNKSGYNKSGVSNIFIIEPRDSKQFDYKVEKKEKIMER